MKQLRIGEVLRDEGYVSEEQISRALEYQKENRNLRLGQIMVDLGYVTEKQLLAALGKRLDLPIYDLFTYKIDEEAAAKLPKQIALKYVAIPIAFENNRLILAINDPLDFYAIEDIRLITTMQIEVVLSEKSGILASIEYYYAEINAKQAAATLNASEDTMIAEATFQDTVESITDGDSPVVKLLNSLLIKGNNSFASDIHIEPYENKTLVRMRIDGMIVDYINLSFTIHQSLIARIKIMAGLDIAEKRLPQDGHFRTKLEGIEMNVRVSVIPTVYGEKAVLRFLNSNVSLDNAQQFGMNQAHYEQVVKLLRNPHGILYITGATGSGKTTTLYMILEYMAKKQVNIVTIEDPVERNVAKVNQMQVNTLAGLTFDTGLRAILRQDPDIIMVGETRDSETAAISVRAAITGHLVISTLHTNDGISAIVRLADMGVEPYLIANSLVGVLAQRLVKKICPHCKEAYASTPEEQAVLGEDTKEIYRGKGCHLCNGTGYKGRVAIHEIIEIDNTVKELISSSAHISKIYDYYTNVKKISTLRESMISMVKQGVTTMEELINATYYVD